MRELPLAGAARQAAGDEDRLVAARDAEALQLVDDRRDRGLARVAQGAGDRQRRRLDDDGDAARPLRDLLERRSRERESKRVADTGGDIGDRLAGRGRAKHDRVVRRADDDEPGPGEERDSWHGRVVKQRPARA